MDCLVNKQVRHGANVGALIMKTRVPGQEGVEANVVERYRGDSNMVALGVTGVIEEYPHESLTFRDVVASEVISKWISVMKEDMDTQSSMYYMGFTCESKAEIWVTNGLLDEAKEIILGMEIFRTQSSNTVRVSRLRNWFLGFLPTISIRAKFKKNKSHNVQRAKTREMSEPGLDCQLLRRRGNIGVAGSLTVGYLRNLNHYNLFFCHKVLGVLVLSFKGDNVLQEVSTTRFWLKEGKDEGFARIGLAAALEELPVATIMAYDNGTLEDEKAKGVGGKRLYVRGEIWLMKYGTNSLWSKSQGRSSRLRNEDQVSSFEADEYDSADVMMAMSVKELLDWIVNSGSSYHMTYKRH
nr:zinc finger, CCHC-type [Tanacetum cinerariifolium]